MNLHLFEVALLIHAKETWEHFFFLRGGGAGWRRGEGAVPSKHRDCLIWLRLLLPVGLVEATLLSKFLHVEAARVDSLLRGQQAALAARRGLSYLISVRAAK